MNESTSVCGNCKKKYRVTGKVVNLGGIPFFMVDEGQAFCPDCRGSKKCVM